MRFAILGPLTVTDSDGAPVEVGGARLRALVALLALRAGHPVSVDQLIDGLWGDDPPANAGNALQSLVSRLRHATAADVVESGPAGYRLVIEPDSVDAHRFETLAAAGRRELAGGRPAEAVEVLAAGLDLWRGPALTGIPDTDQVRAAAARLDRLWIDAVEDHAEAALLVGRHTELVGDLDRLSREHPLRERLASLLIRALAAAGRRPEALAAYERVRQELAERLGVDPSLDLAGLHLALLRDDPAVAPKPAAEYGHAHLTSFVGREDDLARVTKLLAEVRLVSLIGPGGSGKTRLADESAARWAERTGERVWFVELAPVTDPRDLTQAVLTALGVREARLLERGTPAAGAQGRLVEALSGDPKLLVLDNCEHLVTAAARLVDSLLSRCPRLRILTTTREPLGITGETLRPVPPLPVPPVGADVADALTYPAVRLLVDRASAVRPDFALVRANVAGAVEVCRRLDGLPLAIELAAARLRSLPIDQLAVRLEDRFRLLTGGSRTALPRHQTLRAVVDWSWELLSEPERLLARRLSLFAGGATLDSAERVCAGALDPPEVWDALAGLVDRSLVDLSGDGDFRYRMLETVRAYGGEKLAEAGEYELTRTAFTRYFVELAEVADKHLRGPDQLEWKARLDAEYDNLMAALRLAVKAGDSAAVDLAAHLSWYWVFLRGIHGEAVDWLARVSDLPDSGTPGAKVIVTAFLGMLTLQSGDFERAKVILAEALSYQGDIEDHWAAMAPVARGMLLTIEGQSEAGIAAVAPLADHPDPWVAAVGLLMSAALAENDGNFAVFERFTPVALERFRAVGDRWGIAASLGSVGRIRSLRGDRVGARDAYADAIAVMAELGAMEDQPYLLTQLGMLVALDGDLAAGRAHMERALTTARSAGLSEGVVVALGGLGTVARMSGELDEARRCQNEALRASTARSMIGQARAVCLAELALVDLAEGDRAAATERAMCAIDTAVSTGDLPILAVTALALARVEAESGRYRRAAELIGAADAVRGTPDLSSAEAARAERTARAGLGDAEYERVYGDSSASSQDDAITLIRSGSTGDAGRRPG